VLPSPFLRSSYAPTFFACFITFAHRFFDPFTIAALPAADSARAESEKEVNVSLQQAALSSLEETGLGMIVEAKAIEPSSARSLQLRIGIDPKQPLLQDSHGEQKGAVDLLFAQRDFTGKRFLQKSNTSTSNCPKRSTKISQQLEWFLSTT
jgi:hypothetical protein